MLASLASKHRCGYSDSTPSPTWSSSPASDSSAPLELDSDDPASRSRTPMWVDPSSAPSDSLESWISSTSLAVLDDVVSLTHGRLVGSGIARSRACRSRLTRGRACYCHLACDRACRGGFARSRGCRFRHARTRACLGRLVYGRLPGTRLCVGCSWRHLTRQSV